MSAPAIAPFPVKQFMRFLPSERRGALPRTLTERKGQSWQRHDTIETAVLLVDPITQRGTGKDWPAAMPELASAYAAGWSYGYALYGATHESMQVYLWRSLPGAQTRNRA